MPVPQVFISATTRDLGSFRKAVSDVLLTLGAHPVIQEHFAPDYRSVLAMLREKIGECDAVICLVGCRYGAEPLKRDADQPRRSYTQLEYEIAVELGKPVFVFVATEDCTLDAAPDEGDELRGLQLEHWKRIVASDRIRMQFHSLGHLTDQVRVMRFDPESLAQGVTSRLTVLLFAELIDAQAVRERRGEAAWARDVLDPYHDLLKRILIRWKGALQSDSPSDCQVNFETGDAAVNAALELHHALRLHVWGDAAPGLRVGIDVGQVVRYGNADDSHTLQAGQALSVSRCLSQLARSGQTFLTRAAFGIAREHVRQLPIPGDGTVSELRWRSYGRYMLADFNEPLDVCEVGVEGQAPLTAPEESERVQRADSLEARRMRGWCPAPGQEVPRRPGWFIDRKLGEGGFGEVWVARHDRTKELRVFKFCFDANRLTSFKRELTLFKLLREALGKREDITGLLEVELDQSPFYLESEFVAGGNLQDWAVADGRLAALPLEERLRRVAEIAKAVAAAHSVGIIHKDLKPSNVLMRQDADGRWLPVLADFGIGAVADRSQLERRGITVTGFTQSMLEPGSSRTDTRMYQPPEANLARPATVQGDVYALGVLLYQVIICEFDQPLGIGWERRLDGVRAGEWVGEAHREGEAPSEPRLQKAPVPAPPGVRPLRALDPSGKLVVRFLREGIGACVDVDPAARLATAAQLVERLQSVEQRVAVEMARREAEEAARQQAEEDRRREEEAQKQAEAARVRAERAALRTRGLRAALAASITALIVVGGLGAFAFTEWRLAETLKDKVEKASKAADQNAEEATRNAAQAVANEKLAEANAEAARQQSQFVLDTLNAVIFDIQSSVANLSGISPIRRRLLDTALGRLEKLSGEFVQRSTADRHTAAALMSLGDLVLKFGEAPQAGDTKGGARPIGGELRGAVEAARQFYMRSMGIFQDLAKADPNDAQGHRDLSVSYERLGNVHLKFGATDEALQSYQEGRKLREALAKSDPANVQAQQDLSQSFYSMAQAHERANDLVRARPWYEKMLGVDRELSQRLPQSAAARREVAVDCEILSRVCSRTRGWTAAVNYERQALDHARAARQIAGNGQPFQWDFSATVWNLGNAQAGAGQLKEARQRYEEAVKGEPKSPGAHNDLAWLLSTCWDDSVRDGKRAVELATKACERTEWKNPFFLGPISVGWVKPTDLL